ncbi:MAG: hypothetical protein R3C28_09205 [Pirellulaceae bacterium]
MILRRCDALLIAGDNVLAVRAHNSQIDNADFLLQTVLDAGTVLNTGVTRQAREYSQALIVPNDARIRFRSYAHGQWSPLRSVDVPVEVAPVRITEVMYHPANPSSQERAAGFDDADDFEFIELANLSDTSIAAWIAFS